MNTFESQWIQKTQKGEDNCQLFSILFGELSKIVQNFRGKGVVTVSLAKALKSVHQIAGAILP